MTLRVLVTAMLLLCAIAAPAAPETGRSVTLDDAYTAALASNELVKIAQEGVTQSEDRIDQAWSYLYPHLDAQGGVTQYNETLPPGGGPYLFQPTTQYQAALVLTQPLYTGGRTLAGLRTARAMRKESGFALAKTKEDLMLQVAAAYYGALKAEHFEEISEESLTRMQSHRAITAREAATRSTKANQSALARADSLVSQAQIAVVRARDGLRMARQTLCLLTKLPPDVVLTEPAPLAPPDEDLAALQETALADRQDYAESRIKAQIAKEAVTIVKGGHLPQLSAVAGMQYVDSRPSTMLDATSYYGGLRLQVPIFEGGLMNAEVEEARSQALQAKLKSDYLKQTIATDVYGAYVHLQTMTSVLDTAKHELAYARKNYAAVRDLFTEGLLASLSLIDGEHALTLAEQELVSARYDQQLAILQLQQATGTLGKGR